MGYDYYQQSGRPGWGTNQFQFGPPPQPNFQPQASWGGYDFYRAHAGTADPYLFDHAWNRVREYGGAPAGGMGVGLEEARHWHRRAYGAMNEVHLLAPNELGHAAAYEAYRTWIHNSHLYESFMGDVERQREALTGLAVAEATRLLQYSTRPVDEYARLSATEAAAHTASYIFYQTRDEDARSRSHYRGGGLDDPYAHDDELLYPRARSMSRHRHRSHSRHRSYSQSGMHLGQPYSSSSMSAVPHTAFPGQYAGSGSMGNTSMAYHSNGAPMGMGMGTGSMYGSPMAMGMGGSPTYPSMPPGIASSYHGSSLGVPTGYSRSRSSSFSYPQQPYMGAPLGSAMSASGMGMPMGTAMSASGMGMPMGTAMSASGMGMPMGNAMSASGLGMPMPMGTAMSASGMGMPMGMPGAQTIVIHKPRKSKHRHHRRSRSSDGDYGYETSSHRY